MKYHLIIYGCQMNKSDAEKVAAVLESLDFIATNQENQADIIVIIACSVRQRAVDRIYSKIRKIKETRQCKTKQRFVSANSQKPFTVLTGCVLESDRKKLAEFFDLIIKIEEIGKLPKLMASWPHGFMVNNSMDKKTRQQCNNEAMKQFNNIQPKHFSNVSAYVPIMTGCNNFCSYCAVPYTRGRETSRPADEILREIESLVKQRYKEIILLGQNVNTYYCKVKSEKLKVKSINQNLKMSLKHENIKTLKQFNNETMKQFNNLTIEQFNNEINFSQLLRLINNIDGDFWLRFVTSNPWDLSDEIIAAMAECEKIGPYLHLPAQSGSNEILKKMNRHYTREQYIKLVQKIRKKIPDLVISTDIIVGFPGETKKQFRETAALMKKIKFAMAYIAAYSPRPGTAAAKLYVDDVSLIEKKQRQKILENILRFSALKNSQQYFGQTVKVLVASSRTAPSNSAGRQNRKQNCAEYFGRTKSFKNVKFASLQKNLIGQFVKVKITQADTWSLAGELLLNC